MPPPVQLIASTAVDLSPQYSPDGSRIAFASTRSGAHQIWTCASDGTRCMQMTELRAGAATGMPQWSHDGRLIVFTSNQAGNSDVYVVPASGGPVRQLTDDVSDDTSPSFSSNSRYIYFTSERAGAAHVWRMPAEGGPAIRISEHPGHSPVESADGRWLYYTYRADGSGSAAMLWRVAASGNGPRVKVLDAVYAGGWTIVGSRLWYRRPTGRTSEIRSRDLSNGNDVVVAFVPPPKSPNDRGLSVSPDGRYLLYTQNDNPGSDLMYVQNVRGNLQ